MGSEIQVQPRGILLHSRPGSLMRLAPVVLLFFVASCNAKGTIRTGVRTRQKRSRLDPGTYSSHLLCQYLSVTHSLLNHLKYPYWCNNPTMKGSRRLRGMQTGPMQMTGILDRRERKCFVCLTQLACCLRDRTSHRHLLMAN